MTVYVHPDVVPSVKRRLDEIPDGVPPFDVLPGPSLGATGCEVHTPFGIIDADLETQLAALERAMNPAEAGCADG